MNRFAIALVGSILLAPVVAYGLGADHQPGTLPIHEGWPAGVYDAVNQPHRVHGYWVNSTDVLFYQGSNKELQEMAQKLSKTTGTKIEIVLHAAAGVAKSPWSKAPIDKADWSVTVSGDSAITKNQNQIRVDVWLGGQVTLEGLSLPKALKVRSDGEIEKFIKRHEKKAEEAG